MTQTTPKLALVKPGGGSTGLNTPADRVDIDVLNANSDKIDAFAVETDGRLDDVEAIQNSRVETFYGTTAGLASLTGMRFGDWYQESDSLKRLMRYNGTSWDAWYSNAPITLTPASGWSTTYPMRYWITDGLLEILPFELTRSSALTVNAGGTYTVGTIPAAYRPSVDRSAGSGTIGVAGNLGAARWMIDASTGALNFISLVANGSMASGGGTGNSVASGGARVEL